MVHACSIVWDLLEGEMAGFICVYPEVSVKLRVKVVCSLLIIWLKSLVEVTAVKLVGALVMVVGGLKGLIRQAPTRRPRKNMLNSFILGIMMPRKLPMRWRRTGGGRE